MEAQYINPFTWYYDKDGRVWMVLAVLTLQICEKKVWLVEAGVDGPKEFDFERVEKLILEGTLKLYVKPKV